MTEAAKIVAALLDAYEVPQEPVPSQFSTGDEEETRNLAAKTPFTAMHHALSVDKKYHPTTWRAVAGSPYADQYRRVFKTDMDAR